MIGDCIIYKHSYKAFTAKFDTDARTYLSEGNAVRSIFHGHALFVAIITRGVVFTRRYITAHFMNFKSEIDD